MVINDELLGCYVEGTCSPEELRAVRRYLVDNPAELERVILLMDKDRALGRKKAPRTRTAPRSYRHLDEAPACLMAPPGAAFLSSPPEPAATKKKKGVDIGKNLDRLFQELEEI